MVEDFGLLVPRRQADDRLPACRVQCPDDEVCLTAETGEDAATHVAGIRLSEQVDLYGGIDGDHHRIESDPGRVVGRLGPEHPQPRVAVGPLVEVVRAAKERRDDLGLLVESSRPFEIEDAV